MAGKQLLKQRIKSITTIRKITKAMEMIANAKLLKTRHLMENNREYSNCIKDTVNDILAGSVAVNNQYLEKNNSPKSAIIIMANNLGMCGGYTAKINAKVLEIVNQDDVLYLVGNKGVNNLINHGYQITSLLSSDGFEFKDAVNISEEVLAKYRNKEIGSVKVVYTEFVNSGTFEPMVMNLLPYIPIKENTKHQEIIYEPNADTILDDLIPMMVTNMIYSTFMRAKTAEQGARRLAMESASDNADELKEKLTLSYNQARQQSITQEITEIVAGADAI
ncbi:MAG: ATP synthase F1 subunit gamma [Erysipelotrichaceae bacterium]|nr:ATP synthase F1 subunit gamma [Erysipelotrichaceae bacterium]